MAQAQIILASASPRRKELLTQIGVACDVLISDVDETPRLGETPLSYVQRMAVEKAQAIASTVLPVLAADTVVVKDGVIMGKPLNAALAVDMLLRLQGAQHEVMTAVALCKQGEVMVAVSCSKVTFCTLTKSQCEAYWQTGEPADKAGGYGIQGLGAMFVERLEGSYSGVMGLPLFETAQLLRQVGIDPLLMRE